MEAGFGHCGPQERIIVQLCGIIEVYSMYQSQLICDQPQSINFIVVLLYIVSRIYYTEYQLQIVRFNLNYTYTWYQIYNDVECMVTTRTREDLCSQYVARSP
jgi:hypothetical protein